MYMHIYVNFYDWFFNVCTEKSLKKSKESVYQEQNAIKICDQLFTIFNMQQTPTMHLPICKLFIEEPRVKKTKIFLNLSFLIK